MQQRELKERVIRPALTAVGLHSEGAEMLLLGTAVIESNLEYLKQIKGPALSFWQIEPATHKDVKKWLSYRDNWKLRDRVLSACLMGVLPDDEALLWNMRYACLIARIVYLRSPEPIPAPTDAHRMALMHKLVYNTPLGKTDAGESFYIFKEIIYG